MSSATVRSTALRDLRRASARLAVLDAYDQARAHAGHDYGGGQRTRELTRRRLELEQLGRINPDVGPNHGLVRWGMPELDTAGYTADELVAAAKAELTPRLARLSDEPLPPGRRRGARAATRKALRDTRKRVYALAERELDAFVAKPLRVRCDQ